MNLRIVSALFLAWWVATAQARPPNIVFILCDDLGYGDISPYGQQKIRTPSLENLAQAGMKFTQHYAGSPVCAPSRCVLMTGKHPGRAFVRDNREVGDWTSGLGQLPLPAEEVTLAERFKAAGYATGAFGKWGLGGVGTPGDPLAQGFDTFFGYNDQRRAHNHYPRELVQDRGTHPLNNIEVDPHGKDKVKEPEDPSAYARFSGPDYAPDLIAAKALQFVLENKDLPFFLYFPTTIPHLSLQVPEDAIAEYKDAFGDQPYPGGDGYLPHRYPRAAYAAMITRMDREVGRLMDLVRQLGLEEDTIFVFTSDNGAVYPLAGTDPAFFASNGALSGFKGSVREGGMRVPLLVTWKGHIAPATLSDRVTGFEDWTPTLLELAGITNDLAGLDGISFAPTLLGREQSPREFLYREFNGYGGQQAVRLGEWKASRTNLVAAARKKQPSAWELFNLASDPRETRNVAAEHPDIVARVDTIARAQHVSSTNFPSPALDQP